jgi:archaemetzincin
VAGKQVRKEDKIIIRPLGEIDHVILEELKKRLGKTFGCEVAIELQGNKLAHAYNPKRKQFLSTSILSDISFSRIEGRVLGVVDVDLYVPGLNFVFGGADIGSSIAIISLFRLSQKRYALPSDRGLSLERTVQEAIYELGHTNGLGHCSDRKCIMYFSNSLMDTDGKQATFCSTCRQILEEKSICRNCRH